MVTEFGRLLREWRHERGMLLRQMADELGWTSAYISAIETGRKPITDKFLATIIEYCAADEGLAQRMKEAAKNSPVRAQIDLMDASSEDRRLVAQFARRYQEISDESKTEIMRLLGV